MKSVLTIDARMICSAGIGTYLQNLLPEIIRLKPEYRFNLLGKNSDFKLFPWTTFKNVKCIECNASIYSLREQWEIPLKTPKETDWFWSPHYNIPLFCRSQLLVTVHDLFHMAKPEFVRALHKRFYAWLMFKIIQRKASVVLFISQFTQKEFLRLVGPLKGKSIVVYNGAPTSWRPVRKSKKISSKPFLLFVGSVKPHKNLVRLVNAFQIIKDDIPHDLLIVGKKEGFITGDAVVLKKGLELGQRLRFTGKVDEKQLRQFYQSADLLILPSLYEGFGMPPLEAMVLGCPVLVSDIPVFHEIYGNSVAYCNPLDTKDISFQILKVLRHRDLRQKLRQKGLKLVRDYSWKKNASTVLKSIKELLNSREV